MKLDLTPEQSAWLRDVLRRWEDDEPLADDEVDALATYWNDDYIDWIDSKEERGAQLTAFEDAYRSAMAVIVGDGKRGCVRVVASRTPVAATGRATPREKRGSWLGNLIGTLVGLAILALFARFAMRIGSRIDANRPTAAATAQPEPAAPKPVKSAAEVVAAKAAQLRESKAAKPSPAKPAPAVRSAWRTITYTGGDNRKHPALVGDGSLAGGCLVIREPRGACLFEIQAPRDDPMGGLSDWSAPVSVFGGDAIRTEQWFRQGNRVATMKVVDDRGDFHPARGRELLDLLLALPEDKDIMLLYPRAGKGNAFVDVPLRGLRAALDSLP